ncbi:hypothetical protein BBN63_19030 [Streptomyces niveus]|uniref:Uncharacterized protein n=2 Tax=Streptomyces niveus TaxID=193462 RepID=A0A1U9QWG2_STRNV|nr:hypothetical protein BBN63_19030 [Streptomyces niveus]
MNGMRTAAFRWRARYKEPWIYEEGAVAVGVLPPLTVLFCFVAPVVACLLGLWTVFGLAMSGPAWVRTWRSVVEVRVEAEGGRRLVLRQRYGRTRRYPLDAVTALRPLQVGLVSPASFDDGDDDESWETDEMVLLVEVGGASHTTYQAPHITSAHIAPLVEALRRACPHVVVAGTEHRMRHAGDVERGMSPG